MPEGVPLLPCLVAVSIYDTKPVHFLSMTCMSIVWIMKKRIIFDRETGYIHTMNFLCLNVNNEYKKKRMMLTSVTSSGINFVSTTGFEKTSGGGISSFCAMV